MTLIGYVSASPQDRHALADQEGDLRGVGCTEIINGGVQGRVNTDGQLIPLLLRLSRDDVLIVESPHRLARTCRQFGDIQSYLERRGIMLRSLCPAVDTSVVAGLLAIRVDLIYAEYADDRAAGREDLDQEASNAARQWEATFREARIAAVPACLREGGRRDLYHVATPSRRTACGWRAWGEPVVRAGDLDPSMRKCQSPACKKGWRDE